MAKGPRCTSTGSKAGKGMPKRGIANSGQPRRGLVARRLLRRDDRIAIVETNRRREMTQTSNRVFDELARLMNDAAGVAQGVRKGIDTLFRSQAQRIPRDLDVVPRGG